MDQFLNLLSSSVEGASGIKPSSYGWLLPSSISGSKLTIGDIDKMASSGTFPTVQGLWQAVAYAILLSFLRLILTRILFKPLANYSLNLKSPAGFKEFPAIDKFIKDNRKKKVDDDMIKTFLSSRSNIGELSESELRLYISSSSKVRSNKAKATKFVEALWRFIFYSCFLAVGFRVLFFPNRQLWIEDSTLHWKNWPNHDISPMTNFYYHIQLGCYVHQLLWTEVSRSDAAEMMLHHFATIFLILLSYLSNLTRMGSSVLLIHDAADVFLESAKCFNYVTKNSKTFVGRACGTCCDVLFGLFATVFFVTRLVLFPRYLVYSLVFEAPQVLGGTWVGYYVYAVLLVILQSLHVFWFYLISVMIYKLVIKGTVEKDDRSDDEGETDDDDSSSNNNNNQDTKKKRN